MGNYCTLAQVQADIDVGGSVIFTSLGITEADITKAEGLINGYIAKKFTTPVVTDQSDGLLLQLTLWLLEYEVFKRGMASDVPDKYKTGYTQAIDTLKAISDGTLTPWTDSTIAHESSIDIETDDPIMDEESLEHV